MGLDFWCKGNCSKSSFLLIQVVWIFIFMLGINLLKKTFFIQQEGISKVRDTFSLVEEKSLGTQILTYTMLEVVR